MIAWTFSDPGVQVACRQIGEAFHRQLHAQIADSHPDDPDHDAMVGQALYLGIEYNAPTLALEAYNQWAKLSGYVPITVACRIEYPNGNTDWILDIQTAVVAVNRRYGITVVSRPEPVTDHGESMVTA